MGVGKMLLPLLLLPQHLKDEVKVRKGGRMKRKGHDKRKKMLAARETRRMKEKN